MCLRLSATGLVSTVGSRFRAGLRSRSRSFGTAGLFVMSSRYEGFPMLCATRWRAALRW